MKKPYRIITFHTTSDALAFQAACTRRALPGKLISIPRSLSAGCGFVWRILLEEAHLLDGLLESKEIEYEKMSDIEL